MTHTHDSLARTARSFGIFAIFVACLGAFFAFFPVFMDAGVKVNIPRSDLVVSLEAEKDPDSFRKLCLMIAEFRQRDTIYYDLIYRNTQRAANQMFLFYLGGGALAAIGFFYLWFRIRALGPPNPPDVKSL